MSTSIEHTDTSRAKGAGLDAGAARPLEGGLYGLETFLLGNAGVDIAPWQHMSLIARCKVVPIINPDYAALADMRETHFNQRICKHCSINEVIGTYFIPEFSQPRNRNRYSQASDDDKKDRNRYAAGVSRIQVRSMQEKFSQMLRIVVVA